MDKNTKTLELRFKNGEKEVVEGVEEVVFDMESMSFMVQKRDGVSTGYDAEDVEWARVF